MYNVSIHAYISHPQLRHQPGDPSSGGWHRIPRSERFQNFSWEGEEGRRAVNGHWDRAGALPSGKLT